MVMSFCVCVWGGALGKCTHSSNEREDGGWGETGLLTLDRPVSPY